MSTSEDQVDVFTGMYFPFHFIALGVGLILLSVIPFYPLLSAFLFVLGFLFISTHYRFAVDRKGKTIRSYLWIMALKRGEKISYNPDSRIYINKSTQSTPYGKITQLEQLNTIYQAYFGISEGQSVLITQSKQEHRVLMRVNRIASSLSMPIKKNYE